MSPGASGGISIAGTLSGVDAAAALATMAAWLGLVAYTTIPAVVERGMLPGVLRIGRRVLVRRDDLLDWLGQKSTPSPERIER